MRITKPLLLALVLAALSPAALASALDGRASAPAAGPAPAASAAGSAAVVLPRQLPRQDAVHRDAYGYVSATTLGKRIQRDAAREQRASARPAAGGATATVVVTATVLPVRTIVVRDGRVVQIWSNTPDRDARNSLYMVRDGSINGPTTRLDASVWAQARRHLAAASRATGRVH